ncbi:UDP-N-acetylglucosamine 1-carboxyvinyltransferase [bacterium]|nr:UDP-N-acetylglucosamine 1-carboxyvinyltransferase [bacterium]
MEYFDIGGSCTIHGEITPSGNKNEALPVIAASLLCSEPVQIDNVPDILDVRNMLKIAADLGAEVSYLSKNSIVINAENVISKPLDRDLCELVRTSILYAGPMVARFGKIVLPPPGGDVIGRRRLDTHFLGLQQLGASYDFNGSVYEIEAKELIGADVFLDEASVTGTENIVMAAVLAKGRSFIRNAATEPHVQGLCRFLNKMGAKIEGIGTNLLVIEGVGELHGCTHTIGFDYIEAGSYIALAAMTKGELLVRGAAADDTMRSVLNTYKKLGIYTEKRGVDLFVPRHERLETVREMNNAIPKIDDGTWPSFPSDLMSIAIVAATQADGTVLFFEKMFESRMFFVDRLVEMGAQIILCDPHRVVVSGSTPLHGSKLDSPDIRAGMALLMAAVSAKGHSRIFNIRQIDRGYESIEVKLASIGAFIERKNG